MKENRDDPFYELAEGKEVKEFGLEDGEEALFFDNISKGELFSSLYISIAMKSDNICRLLDRHTSLTYIKDYTNNAVLVENNSSIFLCYGCSRINGNDFISSIDMITENKFGGKVHKGYFELAEKVKPLQVYKEVKEKNKKRLVVCNHERDIKVNCITFGDPLCVSREIVERCKEKGFDKRFVNFVNEGDIIPTITNKDSYCIYCYIILFNVFKIVAAGSIATATYPSFALKCFSTCWSYLLVYFSPLIKAVGSYYNEKKLAISTYQPVRTYYFCNKNRNNYIELWEERYGKEIMSLLDHEVKFRSYNKHNISTYFNNIYEFIERESIDKYMDYYTRINYQLTVQ